MGQPKAAKKEAGLKVKLVNQVMVTSNTSTSLTSLEKKSHPQKDEDDEEQQIPIDFVWICLDGGFSPTPLKNDGVSSSVGLYLPNWMWEIHVPNRHQPVVEIYLSASFWDFWGPLYCFFQPWSPA